MGVTIGKWTLARAAAALRAVLAVTALLGAFAPKSSAATPAWKVLAVAGPTNLARLQSEIQRVTIEAEGGRFRLGVSTGDGSPPSVSYSESVPFDVAPATLQAALEAVPALGPGSVIVEGGPGGDGNRPYTVSFGGREAGGPLADRDVSPMVVDVDALEGSSSSADVSTLIPGGPGTGQIDISPVNVGGAATSGDQTLELGPLPPGIVVRADAHGDGWSCAGGAGEAGVVCDSEVPVAGLRTAPNLLVPVEVRSSAEFTASVPVRISGGGAGSATYQLPITVSPRRAEFGIAAGFVGAFDSDGKPETQAGAHPYSAITYFLLNTVRLANGQLLAPGDPRNLFVDLPAGFLGNPLATPRCPQSQLTPPEPKEGYSPICGAASRLGAFQPAINVFGELPTNLRTPIFNDVPPAGYAAEFTTVLGFPFQSLLGSVRTSEDNGLRVSALNVPTYVPIFGGFVAIDGFPEGAGGRPFLSNPTSCSEGVREAPFVRVQTETWQRPGFLSPPTDSGQPSVTGCDRLRFGPGFGLQPTATAGSSGTGAAVDLHVPQEGLSDPTKLATPALKKAVVRLPAGLALNPSAATGLQSCSEQQMGLTGTDLPLPNPIRFDEAAPACPDGSKLGTVEVDSPLLESPLPGTIYLATPGENPFNSLLAVYLAIESPRFGLQIKLPGEVRADPDTGRLTATFDHAPQLPFEDLKLSFRGGGARSLFATPEVCGHYATAGELEPWSAPESGPPAQIAEGGFDVSGSCSSSLESRPFAPTIEAGTTGTQAGAYSPLVIKVGRGDGEGELRSLDFTLPKGLLGRVAGIPYCPEAAIHAAEGKSGRDEKAFPSCPAASRIGRVDAAAGVGPEPFHVGGEVYLAGPYEGAPLSAVVVTPAVAGPFDLGDVVIRAPLRVDPETAQITASSDPIPTILQGIPLKLRQVALYLDRPDFTLNPTSCEPTAITASVGGSDGQAATPQSRFQVGGCDALRFRPRLKLSLKGATGRGGHPGLTATLSDVPGEATPASAGFSVPPGELLDLKRIHGLCARTVSADRCPPGSRLGSVRIESSFLPEPLTGDLYLRVPDRHLPDLVASLHAGSLAFTLHGRITSAKGRLGVRLESLPDVPLSRVTLTLAGGRRGILVNSRSACGRRHVVRAILNGHNGARRGLRVRVGVPGCR